jgi:hypothetical protein
MDYRRQALVWDSPWSSMSTVSIGRPRLSSMAWWVFRNSRQKSGPNDGRVVGLFLPDCPMHGNLRQESRSLWFNCADDLILSIMRQDQKPDPPCSPVRAKGIVKHKSTSWNSTADECMHRLSESKQQSWTSCTVGTYNKVQEVDCLPIVLWPASIASRK